MRFRRGRIRLRRRGHKVPVEVDDRGGKGYAFGRDCVKVYEYPMYKTNSHISCMLRVKRLHTETTLQTLVQPSKVGKEHSGTA